MSASQSNLPGGPPHSRARQLALVACIMGLGYGCADDGRNPTSVTEASLGLSAMSMDCDITVPTDQPTIQAAIDAADPGDTICVEPGVYPEELTVNKQNLTLEGPNVGVHGADPRGPEAEIVGKFLRMRGPADGFVLDGFRIESSGRAIYADNIATIRNNVLIGVQPATESFQSGVFSGTTRSLVVERNLIEGFDRGLTLDGGPGSMPSTFEDNVIRVVGTGISTFASLFLSLGHEIRGNVIADNVGTGILMAGRAVTSGVQGTTFTIEENDLRNNNHGIVAGVAETHSAEDLVVTQNNIEFNRTTGFWNRGPGEIDATCNWWGSPTGPNHPDNPTGTGNPVVGDVDFNPWLIFRAPSDCPAEPFVTPPPRVTGGGQIHVNNGRGNFGFNAQHRGGEVKGHLNYRNHVTRAHLNCTVDGVAVLGNTAFIEGTCSDRSDADSFVARVEDHGEPGRDDRFEITYNMTTDGASRTIRSGNIKIHR